MKNLAFVARHVGCAIARKACVNGFHIFGLGVHPSHLPMYCWGPWGGGQLRTTEVQSSLSHFTRQRRSILWHLQYAFDDAPRQGTIQRQETCRMTTDTIKLLDEGGMQGCNCKCKGTKSIQNLTLPLPLPWFNAFSLGNQIHNSQLLLVCPNNV